VADCIQLRWAMLVVRRQSSEWLDPADVGPAFHDHHHDDFGLVFIDADRGRRSRTSCTQRRAR